MAVGGFKVWGLGRLRVYQGFGVLGFRFRA